MDRGEWMDVWRLAISVAAREPVFVQIALALAMALVFILCLEGLYASLCPRSYAARLARNYGEASLVAREPPQLQEAASPAGVARRPQPMGRPKIARPKFRRANLVNAREREP
jgi:hypothetical protein